MFHELESTALLRREGSGSPSLYEQCYGADNHAYYGRKDNPDSHVAQRDEQHSIPNIHIIPNTAAGVCEPARGPSEDISEHVGDHNHYACVEHKQDDILKQIFIGSSGVP